MPAELVVLISVVVPNVFVVCSRFVVLISSDVFVVSNAVDDVRSVISVRLKFQIELDYDFSWDKMISRSKSYQFLSMW